MVVSVSTAKSIARIVAKHVPRDEWKQMIAELKVVPGNQSYHDTIKRVEQILNEKLRSEH